MTSAAVRVAGLWAEFQVTKSAYAGIATIIAINNANARNINLNIIHLRTYLQSPNESFHLDH